MRTDGQWTTCGKAQPLNLPGSDRSALRLITEIALFGRLSLEQGGHAGPATWGAGSGGNPVSPPGSLRIHAVVFELGPRQTKDSSRRDQRHALEGPIPQATVLGPRLTSVDQCPCVREADQARGHATSGYGFAETSFCPGRLGSRPQ
jgi:hypothetical protein